jgi:two-component system sensor histidine kinase/response regulator
LATHCQIAEPQAVDERKVCVLLVEDNAGDARLIRESLIESTNSGFDVENADRLSAALARLSEGGIDAVLLDLALPDSQGWATFDSIRAHAPALPVIVLTGLGDEALALKMVQKGAQDYVAKMELHGGILPRAIRYAIERERADQQIRRFNENLEHQVQDRTAELEAANRELETFSYSVSHDLRAPIRHIEGFSRILADHSEAVLDDEGKNCLKHICQATERMSAIIEALLKLARLGRQPLALRATDTLQLVQEVVMRVQEETSDRRIEWRIGALPIVQCDRDLIGQVFANLIDNAVKYSRGRTPAVIEVGQTTADGRPAIFVKDNGAGFEMKYADKLFGAFQRLHDVREFEGTGVGLATVQRIIHRHGGRIWAEAETDKGATFYFSLL